MSAYCSLCSATLMLTQGIFGPRIKQDDAEDINQGGRCGVAHAALDFWPTFAAALQSDCGSVKPTNSFSNILSPNHEPKKHRLRAGNKISHNVSHFGFYKCLNIRILFIEILIYGLNS